MAWLRWGGSNWYAFDNVNGKFSLWHISGPNLDIAYEDIKQGFGSDGEWLRDYYPSASEEDLEQAKKLLEKVLDSHFGM